MLKSVVVATAAALAVAGSSIVYAQQHFGGPGGNGDGARFEQRHRPSAADMAAFTDARIAALKAGLELTPDQTKNWPAFEQALRDMAQLRIEGVKAREARESQAEQGQTPISPFEWLGQRADRMAKASAALKRIADTGAPLYQSLDDAQKARFKKLARMLRPHHHHFARNEDFGRGWREGEGYGRDTWQGRPWWRHDRHGFGEEDHGSEL
jgi:zinc resistance-associated protein